MKVDKTAAKPTPIKVIDLFCGCGGFSLGAARAGFQIVGGIDSDAQAIATHSRNFKKSKDLWLDILDVTGAGIVDLLKLNQADNIGLIGGPPCQGFSSIGKNDSSDPRNRLFRRFFELVDELRPLFFVCENVPGILRPNYQTLIDDALSIVMPCYDVVGPMKLRASDYGAPTSRTRVFFIGILKSEKLGLSEDDFKPPAAIRTTNVGEALKGLPSRINENWQHESQGWRKVRRNETAKTFFEKRLYGMLPCGLGDAEAKQRLATDNRVSGCLGTIHRPETVIRFRSVAEGEIDKVSRAPRLNRSGFCPTLRAGTAKDRGSYQALRPIHPTEDRVITPREAARLQGFPDWFRFDPTKWHSFRQIGNSVSPILSEFIMSTIQGKFSK